MVPEHLSALTQPDKTRPGPLSVQMYRDLLTAILDGRATGYLPASRRAATALGLSRNTVNAAYELLRAEGAVQISPGAPPLIIATPRETHSGLTPTMTGRLSQRGQRWSDTKRQPISGWLAPGHPDLSLFPQDEWAMLLRRSARQIPGEAGAYRHFAALPQFRETLAKRLRTDRGMQVKPEQILITPGSQASLSLLAMTLADPGDCALIEDPGYIGARLAFMGAGLQITPIPVDREGADLKLAPKARLVYLTPANQYPLGHRMSVTRRNAAVAFARQHDAVIIEDDYDSEFLWHGREIAALQGSAPDRVITLGTVSKVLMPGLRLGWIVAPSWLASDLEAAHRSLGLAANMHTQMALATMMDEGRYRAHLHRIARCYGERGRAFAAALRQIDGVRVSEPAGGVQFTIHLPDGAEAKAVEALRKAGFATGALSDYCQRQRQSGLVSGFAEATPERIAQFCQVLSKALSR